MKSRQNSVSKEIPKLKKEGKDATPVLEEMKSLAEQIKNMDEQIKEVEQEIQNKLLEIPNTPHFSVPDGKTDEENVEIKNGESLENLILKIKHIGTSALI